MSHLPHDPKSRKAVPLYSGLLKYFPDALIAVADLSRVGNDQHNPGQPLHWAKEKSTDETDALMRHLVDAGTRDTDGVRHSTKVAWRALANLQREIEADKEKAGQVDPALLVTKEPQPGDRYSEADPVEWVTTKIPNMFIKAPRAKEADAGLGPDPKDTTRRER